MVQNKMPWFTLSLVHQLQVHIYFNDCEIYSHNCLISLKDLSFTPSHQTPLVILK